MAVVAKDVNLMKFREATKAEENVAREYLAEFHGDLAKAVAKYK